MDALTLAPGDRIGLKVDYPVRIRRFTRTRKGAVKLERGFSHASIDVLSHPGDGDIDRSETHPRVFTLRPLDQVDIPQVVVGPIRSIHDLGDGAFDIHVGPAEHTYVLSVSRGDDRAAGFRDLPAGHRSLVLRSAFLGAAMLLFIAACVAGIVQNFAG